MENITITADLIQTAIMNAMPEILKDKLSSSYSSPIAKVIDAALKENEGQIAIFVSALISESLTDPAFKDKLAKVVLAKIVESGLKNK